MKPTFLHIGAPRCGTTWMFKCICEHPEVWRPHKKEIRYFVTSKFDKGKKWYLDQFHPDKSHKAWGEASPQYLSGTVYGSDKPVAKKAHELLPDCDIICCFRDPIERAYSHWKMMEDWHGISVSFEEAVKRDIRGCASKGLYYNHIKKWRRYYSNDKFLVQIHKQVLENNLEEVRRIYNHIGVSDSFKPSLINMSVNRNLMPRTKKMVNNVLGKKAYTKLASSKISEYIRRISNKVQKNKSRYSIKKEIKNYLTDYYKESNRRLKEEMKVDIDHW